MTRWKSRKKKTLVLTALLLVLGVVGFGAVAPVQAAGDPTDLVPKDCFFCVRINNLDNALGQVDMFLTGLFPMGISMMAKMQLGQFLGGPQPQGIDMAGGFAIFSPIPGSPDPTAIGVLVPVSSYETFVSQNANVGAADAQGLSQIGPPDSPMLVARKFGDYALISPVGNEQALIGATKPTAALSADLDPAESKRATTAPIWAFGNLQSTGQMFGPMIQAQLGGMKEMMASGQGPEAEATAGMMDMYSGMLDSLMKEGKYVSLALTPSGEKISLGAVVGSVPGSKMAEMLQGGQSTANPKVTQCLDDGACMNVVGKNTPLLKKFNDMYINEMFPKMMGDNLSDEEMQEFKTIAKDAMDAFGGAIAASVVTAPKSKPPFAVKYIAELNDAQKFRKLLDEGTKAMSSGSIGRFYEEMGMKMSFDVKQKAETYKGVAIDTIKFNMTPTEADSSEAEAMGAILGDGLNIQMAATDGLLVYALSENPGPAIRELIDQVKSTTPATPSSEVQTAMKLIPGSETADLFATFNVVRLMQIAKAVAPEEIPLPEGALASQSNVAVASKVKDGKATLDLAVPKQHVLEIMQIVMQMQQGM